MMRGRFVRYNYLKLFRIFIVGFVAFIMLDAITPSMHRYAWAEVVGMLGMFANLFEDPSHVVWPGPYWYFSITLQLYILYRLLFYRWRHWGVVLAAIVLCWIGQLSFENDAVTLERLRYNFIGGMLPFGMGLLLARFEPKCKDWVITKSPSLIIAWIVNLLLAIVFCFMFSSRFDNWLWVPALIVWGTVPLVKLMPERVLNLFVWLGSISAAIFVTHPLVRKIFVRPYIQDDMYAGLLLYIVATLLMSWIVKQIIDRIPSPNL